MTPARVRATLKAAGVTGNERRRVAMTEILKKEFSRATFVKGGGALIVGLSAIGVGMAPKPRRQPCTGSGRARCL